MRKYHEKTKVGQRGFVKKMKSVEMLPKSTLLCLRIYALGAQIGDFPSEGNSQFLISSLGEMINLGLPVFLLFVENAARSHKA